MYIPATINLKIINYYSTKLPEGNYTLSMIKLGTLDNFIKYPNFNEMYLPVTLEVTNNTEIFEQTSPILSI